MESKTVANFFYEECTGVTTYANVPHNKAIYHLVQARTNSHRGGPAATKEEFADFLKDVADKLVD